MSVIATITGWLEQIDVPDALLRLGVRTLVGRTSRHLVGTDPRASGAFATAMANYPIAINTADANAQHYEVPAAFFALVLGPQRKYSSCLYPSAQTTLAEAEEHALSETAEHADLADGQRILELGCGWGSLSLWMAKHYPNAQIVSVSNSQSQRAYIESAAVKRGLANLRVITADMNAFDIEGPFDRIVSVEMFEHMSNWRPLLEKARRWLSPDGRMFIHIFTHRSAPYRFEVGDKADWIAQHFFTGGIMPSHDLMREFPDLFEVERDWRWSGENYRRTATDWLANFDAHRAEIADIFEPVYGGDTPIWMRRWRLFFLATEGLFGFDRGREWAVSHYRLKPASR